MSPALWSFSSVTVLIRRWVYKNSQGFNLHLLGDFMVEHVLTCASDSVWVTCLSKPLSILNSVVRAGEMAQLLTGFATLPNGPDSRSQHPGWRAHSHPQL